MPEQRPPRRITVRTTAQTRAVGQSAAGAPVVDFVISTGGIKRDGDTIDQAGWQLETYRKNPVVMYSHGWSALPIQVVGRCTDVRVENDQLMARCEFVSRDVYELGYTVGRMVADGFLHSASVRWDPLKWQYDEKRGGFDFIEQELLEWSIVDVPADPDAVAMRAVSVGAAKSYREHLDALRRALDEADPSAAATKAWQDQVRAAITAGERDAAFLAAAKNLTR